MKYFYMNFARVLRGDWWVYPETDSLETYEAKIASMSDYKVVDDEQYFQRILLFLSYNFFGLAEEVARISDSSPKEAMKKLLETPVVSRAPRDFAGAIMPVERFLEIYKSSSWPAYSGIPYDSHYVESDKKDVRKSIKNKTRAETIAFFLQAYHKRLEPIDSAESTAPRSDHGQQLRHQARLMLAPETPHM